MTLKSAYQETNPEDNTYWNDMRNHDYSASFPVVKNFIRHNSPQMKRPKNTRKRMALLLAVLLPMLLFFSCQRNTYIEPQGATLSFTAKDSLQTTIDYILRQYADKEWKAVFWPRNGIVRGVISTSAEQYEKLQQVTEKLKAIPGITEIYLSAVKTATKESPLSRLSYKLFNWHFNTVDVSDEKLHVAIASKLKETGQPNLQLKLVKENGRKQVSLIPNGNTHNFSIEFTLLDGSYVTAIAEKWQ